MNTSTTHTHITTTDFFKTKETFQLVLDSEKEYLKTIPQPKEDALEFYYESDTYISHSDTQKGFVPFVYRMVKRWSLQNKIRLVSKLSQTKGTLLDIGAGTGSFLEVAKEKQWTIFGVEPNEKARTFAATKNILLQQSLTQFKGEQFDVITLWHVLEHLPNLESTIDTIEALLKPGGTLCIAVPNYKSYDATYYKEYWAAYDVPRHLWHFSQQSMSLLFSKKMHLVKTQPMLFDSFYVSLLSEKYKTGNPFSIRALWIGLLSNIKATQTKEYSSLIYCFKKE